VTSTVTFRPFFPRQIKLCIYLSNATGERAVFEQIVGIPAGYGVQRSSGYNCSNFSRYSAQDYYWLYPGDPSGLDADNDGAACESNPGPGPGPRSRPSRRPRRQRAQMASTTTGMELRTFSTRTA
jgi:Excalibur calcium-binding domain